MQDNQLPEIAAGVFDGLASLSYVDLSHNRLKSESLPGAFLRRATKLRHVYLDDNQLETIDSWWRRRRQEDEGREEEQQGQGQEEKEKSLRFVSTIFGAIHICVYVCKRTGKRKAKGKGIGK